jgi:hypothetical protein
MPLGIVSNEDFEREIEKGSSRNNLEIISRIIEKKPLGRPLDKPPVPETAKKLIAEEVLLGADRKELANTFNVGEQMPNVFVKGATSASSYNNKNQAIVEHLNSVRGKIVKRASNKLLNALGHITEDKLTEQDARSLAGIAKDMSAIVKNMEPQSGSEGNNGGNRVAIIFHAPKEKPLESFDVINIKDNE